MNYQKTGTAAHPARCRQFYLGYHLKCAAFISMNSCSLSDLRKNTKQLILFYVQTGR